MEKPVLIISQPIYQARHRLNTQSIEIIKQLGLFNVIVVEVYGMSEIARARCAVATATVKMIKSLLDSGILAENINVLWFDSDMVLLKPQTIVNHYLAVKETGYAISGRAIIRQHNNRIAASMDSNREKKSIFLSDDVKVELTPVLAGLGCLMLPADKFMAQADISPKLYDKNGEFLEYLVCCPRIEDNPNGPGSIMVSEDFDYSRRIPGGAWLAEIIMFNHDDIDRLDYGHVIEQVAHSANIPIKGE